MKKSMIVAVIVAGIAVPAGVYAASPLFINTTIEEPLPVAYDEMMEDKPMEDPAITDKSGDKMMEKELAGNFAGAGDGIHNAEGVAKVVYLKDGRNVLRLENLKATNGPDLHVYLATDNHASDFVDLGRLKANIGSQNYEIPEGTDLSKYSTVLVWCKHFQCSLGVQS
jgi:electron transfer DM13